MPVQTKEKPTSTPSMRQWERTKSQYPDTLLLFRMGDFYELFNDDAAIVSKECGLVLTARGKTGPAPVPFCGVPYHSVERHIATLLSRGFRVAVCEQMEDAKYARGLVKREVVRVLSPGTVMEDAFLTGVGAATGNNYLAALSCNVKLSRFGLALIDVSTGEFLSGEIEGDSSVAEPCETDEQTIPGTDVTPENAEHGARFARLREELLRFTPAEVLVPQKLRECPGFMEMLEKLHLRTTAFDAAGFDTPHDKLLRHFKTMSLRGFGIEDQVLAQESASLALDYLKESHLSALGHIRRITLLATDGWMILDNATRRNLELAQSMRDGSSKGTLLELLDETRTGAGARLLRKWILQPLLSKERIERRLDAVAELRDNLLLRRDCRDLLKSVGDIERLVARCVSGTGNARDLVALKDALQTLPALKVALTEARAGALTNVDQHLDPAPDLRALLESALAEDPPAILTDGGLIKAGYDDGLDELRVASRDGKNWMAALEETERARTGIPSLKVSFNNVFGYFIEVTNTHKSKVPPEYTRKQTTANGERFFTSELKEKEELILGAEDKIKDLERRLFENVRAQVVGHSSALLDTARALAHLDVYASLSEVASRRDYVRPQIEEEPILDIRSGRHPIVEAHTTEPFVPNDAVLDCDSQQEIIITGPNASGKSTFLRQVALITLMAQIGSFVPAREAKIGLVDRIFTRVGAQDDLATGQSTFTVEMNETANILNNATPRSLVILDEVGRGTSTYDGLSIAWAVAEFLHELGPKTLFATHYHHLNELEERLPRVKNYRIAVKEDGDHIIFLRRIIRGGTDRSFGIQVARLAGLPSSVVSRARELLESFSQEKLRGQSPDTTKIEAPRAPRNGDLFAEPTPENPVVAELKSLEISEMTPVQAMIKLEQLQKLAKA